MKYFFLIQKFFQHVFPFLSFINAMVLKRKKITMPLKSENYPSKGT